MKKIVKYISVFCMTISCHISIAQIAASTVAVSQSTDQPPLYYSLLTSDSIDVEKVVSAYDEYYKTHEWNKNKYTRAFFDFMRAHPYYTFEKLNTGGVSESLMQDKRNRSIVGNEWKALEVKIERTDCNGPGQNGMVRSLAVHPKNANVLFAGAMNGGIWKTTNKGLSWSESLIKNLPFVSCVNKIVVSKADPNYVYAATNGGVIKSTDGGTTFSMTSLDYTPSFPNLSGLFKEYTFVDISPNDPKVIIASNRGPSGSTCKLSRSIDGGGTWSNYSFSNNSFLIDILFHPVNPSIVYTLVQQEDKNINFYRSVDGGASFTKITNGFCNFVNTNKKEAKARLAVTPAQPDLVLFYLNVADEGTGFYSSSDAGVSWKKICCGNAADFINNANTERDYIGEAHVPSQMRWSTTLAVSNTNSNIVLAGTNRPPKYSFDQMKTWWWSGSKVNVSDGNPRIVISRSGCTRGIHGDIQDVIINGNDIWIANDGGIVLSEDGGKTFYERGDGMPVTMALGFDNIPGKRDVMVVANDHNGVLVYDKSVYGDYWKLLGGGDASGASVNPVDDYWVYAIPNGMSGSGITNRPKTGPSNGGISWQNGIDFGTGYKSRFNNVQAHPNSHYTLYSINYADWTLVKSIDNGKNWSPLKKLQSGSAYSYSEVKVSFSDPNILYLTDRASGNEVSKSIDGGANWTSILPSLASGDVVRNIEIDAKDPNIIWLTINNSQPKVLKSTDGGKTWTDYSTGLSKYKIVSIVHQKGSNGGVYVGTQYGVYYRDNSLSSWVSYGFNLPGEGINFLKINYYSQKIRAATIRGIWENDLYQPSKPVAVISSDVTSIPCNSKTPVRFSAAASALSGNGTKYEWSFQGGVPATSSSEIVDVFYPKAGNYDVTLTVKDNYGSDVSTLVKQITVTGSCAASTEIVASSIDGTASICVSTPISATITNGGMNVINSYTLKSYLNGVLDKTINRNVSLTTGASDVVTLGNYTLKNISEVKVVVENPNGTADNTSNNTVTINPVGVVMSTPFISVTSQSSNDPFNTADLIFDKNINTYWQSNSSSGASLPYTLVFNLNGIYDINGFELLNRQYNNGAYPKDIEISASSDNVNWGTAQKLTFASSSSWQSKSFIASNIKFLRVKILSTISGSTSCSIAEIRLKGCSNSPNEIETHSTPNELFIFPNPAQDKIKIQTEEIMQQVLLIDAKGAEHLLKSENGYYDINSFSQGIYILKLTGRDKVYHSKLVISR